LAALESRVKNRALLGWRSGHTDRRRWVQMLRCDERNQETTHADAISKKLVDISQRSSLGVTLVSRPCSVWSSFFSWLHFSITLYIN